MQLYQTHYLYDALIYSYTRAMRDYVVPLLEMIGPIRKVMQLCSSLMPPETAVAPLIVNAFKVYPYLADVLTGLTYRARSRWMKTRRREARLVQYAFLFLGCSGT